jgi:hypothetical protein
VGLLLEKIYEYLSISRNSPKSTRPSGFETYRQPATATTKHLIESFATH